MQDDKPVTVSDARAQQLEEAGLWRRAAARWSEVLNRPALDERQCAQIQARLRWCLAQVKKTVIQDIRVGHREVANAARATLREMGQMHASRDTFRELRFRRRKRDG